MLKHLSKLQVGVVGEPSSKALQVGVGEMSNKRLTQNAQNRCRSPSSCLLLPTLWPSHLHRWTKRESSVCASCMVLQDQTAHYPLTAGPPIPHCPL